MISRHLLRLMLLCAAILTMPAAFAQRWDNGFRAQSPSSTGSGLSSTIQRLESQSGGRVLSADRVQSNGRSQYRIKLLTPEGHVRTLYVDAN